MYTMVFLIILAVLLEARLKTDIINEQPGWWIMFGLAIFLILLSYIFGFNWWYPSTQTSIRVLGKILCKKLY